MGWTGFFCIQDIISSDPGCLDGSGYSIVSRELGTSMNDEEIQQVFTSLNASFSPERARGIDTVIQIEVIGEGDYNITIRDQKISFAVGKAPGARLTLRGKSHDLIDIFHRKLDPATAFFQGKLSVKGDTGLALKLPGLFQ